MTDPSLRFWLRHVETRGGLWEQAGDSTLVVLPAVMGERYHLAEELLVSADPDVAREDGVAFLGAGHPVLTQAAEEVLASGDAGNLLLDRPRSLPPSGEVLLQHARDQFPVAHGRIDLTGTVIPVQHPVLRVGALVTYDLSSEDRFQEQAERWVDVPSRQQLSADVAGRLARTAVAEDGRPERPEDLVPALTEAHRLIDAAAIERRAGLAGQLAEAHAAERARATGYYDDAVAGIERRLATASADRRAVLQARLSSTREEQARRLAEIAEKYQARHQIRPFRLHVVAVPALRLPVHVRRGERRYPTHFDWLLPAATYAPIRCPACSSGTPLVATKTKLGCASCAPTTGSPAG